MIGSGLYIFDSLLYYGGLVCVCIEGEKCCPSQRGAMEWFPPQRSVIYELTTRGQCGAIFLHMLRALQL